MKTLLGLTTVCLALALAMLGTAPRARAGDDNSKPADVLASFWAMPKEDNSVTLMALGQQKPATMALQDSTIMGGICFHCQLKLRFKASDAGKRCTVCPCPMSSARCVAGKALKPDNWQQMLLALPKGTGLHAVYNEEGKPESGLKSLVVDHKAALLPVDGLSSETPAQLLALVKPLGGTKAELAADGKQLQIAFKEDWTAEKETKFEKALEKAGGKLTYPAEPAAQK